jgi:outer membrane protein OmpA-like peptidoglycan-associated protein
MTRISLTLGALPPPPSASRPAPRPEGTPDRTATGALIGAAGGAALGQALGRDSRSTLIGAGLGAAAGAVGGRVLDQQAAELERQLAGTGAGVVNTGNEIVVSLPEAITFDFGSAALRPQFRQPLLGVARNLLDYPNSDVTIIGHTDNVGSRTVNQRLSEQRAQSVASVLQQGGVPAWRLQTVGRAFDQPIATNATAEGRAQNRRVEIVIRPRPQA